MTPEAGEPPAEVYRNYLESGVLGFQRCAGCGAPVFYPRVLCPVCWGKDLTWGTSSGLGVVYATTAVYRREGDPYNVVLVHGNGGVLSSQVTAVLGSESTL